MSDLRGQDTDEAREAVKAQREAAKAAKAAAKAERKAKAAGKGNSTEASESSAADAEPTMLSPPVPAGAPQYADPAATEEAPASDADRERVLAQREAAKAAKAAAKAERVAKAAAATTPGVATPAAAAPAAAAPAAAARVAPKAAAAPTAVTEAPPRSPAACPAKPAAKLPDRGAIAPAVAELGILMRSFRVVGANARCAALVTVLRKLVAESPQTQTLHALSLKTAESINALVNLNAEFLRGCRAFCPGMQYAVKLFRDKMMRSAARDDAAKLDPRKVAERHLTDILADVLSAVDDVTAHGATRIVDGDVILTYGRSSAIEALLTTEASKKQFTVIIVDSGPLYEGRGLQWRLEQRRIKTSYVLLTSVCATMARCTKAFIGAAAVLQSGQILGRAGTAVVSLVAKQFRKPLLCFCETYKFTSRSWLGQSDGGETARVGELLYDLTPKEMVDIVVSDIGLLHPTAAAAAIRDRDERDSRADNFTALK